MNSRAMLWSLRRELAENRSIYIAPAVVAAFILIASFIGTIAGRNRRPANIASHFDLAAGALMATTLIVAIFYCLDALYGERRDRSILFWKSMPVSDTTTVLSKFAVPLVILPLVTFAITIAMQILMLLTTSAGLLLTGRSAAAVWSLPWLRITIGLLYHLVSVHSLSYAPIFGWLLLTSAWARRLPFLWAFLPPVVIAAVEKIVFNSSHFVALLGSIISGGEMGNSMRGRGSMFTHIDAAIWSRPALWIGMIVAAACVAGAVRLRRQNVPI